MKKYFLKIALAVVALIALIALSGSFFVLNEGESAIVQRFGRIEAVFVKDIPAGFNEQLQSAGYGYVKVQTGTGLRFKVPFIDSVIKYSSKLTTYDTLARQVITSDKKKLTFDNNAQWRIANPVMFYTAVNNVASASDRIDNIVYSRMNDKVGKMDSHILIADKEAVSQMLDELTSEVNYQSMEFGVEVHDIRIKRTDLPAENYESIYNRMITERNRIAAQYRSEGDEEAIKIRSETDRQVTVITSEANRKAEILKGEGDAEAARVFNDVYGSNPEFFEFYNILLTYRETLGDTTTLVIPNSSPFAKYLTGTGTGVTAARTEMPNAE